MEKNCYFQFLAAGPLKIYMESSTCQVGQWGKNVTLNPAVTLFPVCKIKLIAHLAPAAYLPYSLESGYQSSYLSERKQISLFPNM